MASFCSHALKTEPRSGRVCGGEHGQLVLDLQLLPSYSIAAGSQEVRQFEIKPGRRQLPHWSGANRSVQRRLSLSANVTRLIRLNMQEICLNTVDRRLALR